MRGKQPSRRGTSFRANVALRYLAFCKMLAACTANEPPTDPVIDYTYAPAAIVDARSADEDSAQSTHTDRTELALPPGRKAVVIETELDGDFTHKIIGPYGFGFMIVEQSDLKPERLPFKSGEIGVYGLAPGTWSLSAISDEYRCENTSFEVPQQDGILVAMKLQIIADEFSRLQTNVSTLDLSKAKIEKIESYLATSYQDERKLVGVEDHAGECVEVKEDDLHPALKVAGVVGYLLLLGLTGYAGP